MLTIFSTCAPFTKEPHTTNQLNALKSWSLLGCEVILFGDEAGVAEVADQYDFVHIPDVSRKWGKPFIPNIYARAEELATNDILAYVNADIILGTDFVDATVFVANKLTQFIIVGGRYALPSSMPQLDFSDGWQERLLRKVIGIHV